MSQKHILPLVALICVLATWGLVFRNKESINTNAQKVYRLDEPLLIESNSLKSVG